MKRCPSRQQLEELLDEQLADAERESISLHISSCRSCQETLDSLTSAVVNASSSIFRKDEKSSASWPSEPLGESEIAFLARLKQGAGVSNGNRGAGPKPAATIPSVDNYEIIGELGRGGMGVVYKARQLGLDRLVALKMILTGLHAGPRDLERFRKEAEAVARLRHPNIIQIYDIGTSEDRPYFALEFVEGKSLAHLLQGTPQPFLPAARLVETLAQAIHYAHQRNIIHRDLKPANILLQVEDTPSYREELKELSPDDAFLLPASVTPKITDFGLAKRLDVHSTGTVTGEVVGTPSYMAPEQAKEGSAIGAAVDVYSLGAILYELLTGRPPFRGPTSLETVLQVLHDEPVRPSFLRPNLPRDLETISLKCLSKEPLDRYASAVDLADDLHRFRRGQPIKARPLGVHERVWKWARHRPASAALVAGIILVTLLGFAGITWQWQEALSARDEKEGLRQEAVDARTAAEFAQDQEIKQRKRARVSLYFSRIAQSQLQWRVNDFTSACKTLAKCAPLPGFDDLRGWEWHYLQALYHNNLFTLHNRTGRGSAAYDPRGRWIASVVGGFQAEANPRPGQVRLWNAQTGQLIHDWAGPATLHRLAFSPDGDRLALGTTDGAVLIWDPVKGTELRRRLLHRDAVSALVFSPDGKHIASASWDHTVIISDSSTGDVVHVLKGHEERVHTLAYHPEGKVLASGGWDTTIRLWDPSNGHEVKLLRGHRNKVYCLTFSPDGKTLVSASSRGNLRIWELASSRIIQSLTADTGGVLGIAFSPDGRSLAKAGKDGTVRLWDLESGGEQMSFRGHAVPVESVHFSPDGQRLVSIAPAEGAVKVWDLTRHPEYATFARTEADVEALAFHEDGARLVSVTMTGAVQFWDAASGLPLEERAVPMHKDPSSPAAGAALAPGGRLLAARSREDKRLVKIWDTGTGGELATLSGHTLPVVCFRFSDDGRRLATCAFNPKEAGLPHEIKVWDTGGGKLLASLVGTGAVFAVTFNPEGGWLAIGGQHGHVTLVDWKTGEQVHRVLGHQGVVSALAFDPKGELLASAGLEDRTVKLWRLQKLLSGSEKNSLTLAGPPLLGDLAFSPDGRRLAGISRDLVKMWDSTTGQEVLTLRGAPQRYWDPAFNPRIAFSADGVLLAGTNWNESISLWEAPRVIREDKFVEYQARKRLLAERRAPLWHLQEAEACLEHKNFSAARFHLQCLANKELGGLQARRSRLAEVLRKQADR
jgi:WD40 repeat protein/serine/threonine protein kinase